MTADKPHTDNLVPVYIGMIAAIVIGEMSLVTMPFVVGALVQFNGIGEGNAGLVMSVQFACMALSSFTLSVIITRIHLKPLALGALGLAIAGNILATLPVDWHVFMTSRILVGLGEGAALAIANSVAAVTPRPHRSFSILSFTYIALGCLMFIVLPIMIGHSSYVAVYYSMAAIALLAGLGLFCLPGQVRVTRHMALPDKLDLYNYIGPIIAFSLLFIVANGLWAYAERIAFALELEIQTLGHIFLTTALVGLSAPVIADYAGRRWGLKNSILGILPVYITALLVWGYATNMLLFALGLILVNTCFLYLVPFYKSLMACVDPSGRLPAASAGFQTAATAIAPGSMGLVLLAGGTYRTIVWATVILIIVSVFSAYRTAALGDRNNFVQ